MSNSSNKIMCWKDVVRGWVRQVKGGCVRTVLMCVKGGNVPFSGWPIGPMIGNTDGETLLVTIALLPLSMLELMPTMPGTPAVAALVSSRPTLIMIVLLSVGMVVVSTDSFTSSFSSCFSTDSAPWALSDTDAAADDDDCVGKAGEGRREGGRERGIEREIWYEWREKKGIF